MMTSYTSSLFDLCVSWYVSLLDSAREKPAPMALAALVGVLMICYLWTLWNSKGKNLPRSPRGWPLLGNLLDLSSDTMHLDYIRLQKANNLPPIFMLDLGPGNKMVVLNEYKYIKDAFEGQGDIFSARPRVTSQTVTGIRDEIFNCLVPDATYKEAKTFAKTALRGVGFGDMTRTENKILEQVEILIDHLKGLTDKGSGSATIDTYSLVKQSMAMIIFRILFNKMYNFDEPELVRRVQAVVTWNTEFGADFFLEFFSPGLAKFLFRGTVKRFKEKTDVIKGFLRDEVMQHKETFDPEHPRDFVDLHLAKRPSMEIETLVCNLYTMIPDSIDTLSSAMNWILLYVTHHPESVKKMQKEIDDATGGSQNVVYADRSKLVFCESFMMEVLRHAAPVLMSGQHTTTKDCNFKGYFLPKGIPVASNLYAAMRDPSYFEDPEKFNPSRFIGTDGQIKRIEAWVPFGIGRRMCLGNNHSMMELFLFFTNLLKRFDFSFPAENPSPTMEPKSYVIFRAPHPYKVVLTERKWN